MALISRARVCDARASARATVSVLPSPLIPLPRLESPEGAGSAAAGVVSTVAGGPKTRGVAGVGMTTLLAASRAALPFRAPRFFLFDVPDALLDQGSPSSFTSPSVSASVVGASVTAESRRPRVGGGERGRATAGV